MIYSCHLYIILLSEQYPEVLQATLCWGSGDCVRLNGRHGRPALQYDRDQGKRSVLMSKADGFPSLKTVLKQLAQPGLVCYHQRHCSRETTHSMGKNVFSVKFSHLKSLLQKLLYKIVL